MAVQTDIDNLKASINGILTRADIFNLLEILVDLDRADTDEYVSAFLDFYPDQKEDITNDLLSYSNYNEK